MRQVLIRAISLLKRPAVAVVALLIAGGGSALVFAPLFGVPGYELSEAVALAVGLLGGIVGGAAGFQERRLIQGKDPRPKSALRVDAAFSASALSIFASFTLLTLLSLPPLFTAVAFALVKSPCDPWKAIAFYPLLVLPSALVASAAGVFCALLGRRAWLAVLLYVALVLGSAAFTAFPLYFGPQAFAYNHFGGYFPGPLYDEALAVRPALLWFRLQTLLCAAFLFLLISFLLDMKDGKLTRPHVRLGSALLLGLVAFAIFTLEDRAPTFGFRMTDSYLQEKLGGKKETEHFTLIYPRGKSKDELERLARDVEFRYSQIKAFLGAAPEGKLRVWIYRSADEKQLLVGAANTQFAKPWRLELHVNDAPFPHGVLKHELTHVMAAVAGSGPFKVTSRFGVWTHIGIVEGLAVASDNPVSELTLHQFAAGMRKQKLMPDVRKLLSPTGFYAAPASRAYTVAGSFLRWLADQHGAEKLRALYAHGDFDGTYGQSLPQLADEWEKFLDALPLDEAAVNLAFARFRQGSLFQRPCAREVASLLDEASDRLRSDPEKALLLYQRCSEIQPDEPTHVMGQAQALLALDRKGEAVNVLMALAEKVKAEPSLLADAEMSLADVAWKRGLPDEAVKHLQAVLAQKPAQALDRTAHLKEAALKSPASKALWSWFDAGPDDVKLLLLQQAIAQAPKDPYANYLIGRRLTLIGAAKLSLPYLATALEGEVAESIRREALRLQLHSTFIAGDCNGVRDLTGRLPDLGEAFKTSAQEWVDRCAFEEKVFNGPLVPEGPFG
ncbi:MAG: hypothetical protein ACJ790_21565 [Myxococcaceae bacterium]